MDQRDQLMYTTPITMGVSCANTGGKAAGIDVRQNLAPEPPVGGGGRVEGLINRLQGGAGGLPRPPWAV